MTMPSARLNQASAVGEKEVGESAAQTGPGSSERPSSGALLVHPAATSDTAAHLGQADIDQAATDQASGEHVDGSISESSEEAFAESSRAALRARSHTRRLGLPYVGLRSFAERDHEFFFGRDQELRRLRAMLDEGRLAAVVGPRKSGRTSLLEAGLAGELRALSEGSDRPWLIGRLDLGSTDHEIGETLRRTFESLTQDPQLVEHDSRRGPRANAERANLVFASLDDASDAVARATQHLLAGTGARLLLIIDNFESLTRKPAKPAQAFVSQVLEATGRSRGHAGFHVALVVRDAELGSCGQFAGLGSALAGRTLVLERPTSAQFEQIIREPARAANWSVSRALVAQLLQDCASWRYPMAELQHALSQMASHAVANGKLDLTSYAAAGCPNAITEQAERLFVGDSTTGEAGLDETARTLAERVFTTLVDCNGGGAAARRLTLAQLAERVGVSDADETLRSVLRKFSAGSCGFLRWFDASSNEHAPKNAQSALIELGHPLLIERWPRYEAWIARDLAQGRIFLELLSAASAERDGSAGLLRGSPLAQAQKWWREFSPTATWAERHCPSNYKSNVEADAARSGNARADAPLSKSRTTSETQGSKSTRFQIDPIELVQQYLRRSADDEQAIQRRAETEHAAQLAQARHSKRRLTLVLGLAALVTVVGGVVLFGVTRERDQALGESEILAEQNAVKDTLNGRLRASEADLRRSLDATRREIESLLVQLEVAEGERAELASNNEVFDQTLTALEQRYKDIVRAHDAALFDAKASREALAAVRTELATARAQLRQAQVSQAQRAPTQSTPASGHVPPMQDRHVPPMQDQGAPANQPSAQSAAEPAAAPAGETQRASVPSRELAPFPSAVSPQPSAPSVNATPKSQ